jgi:TonB family protein
MKPSAVPSLETTDAHDVDIITFVMWSGCLLIGILGLAIPYALPPPRRLTPPTKVEILNVELKHDLPTPTPTPAESPSAPSKTVVQTSIPQPIAVAEPSSAIAFAVPVEAPARIVESHQAVYTSPTPAEKPSPVLPSPQTLTFGRGEGKQPAPDYPFRAQREGQEGNVTVRFTVAPDGHVVAAEVLSPSPWALLNESAQRTILSRWQFPSGLVRVYDIVIRFELTQ